MHRISKILPPALVALFLAVFAGCTSQPAQYPSPPGTAAAKLEHAGANYQATEEAPTFRESNLDQPSAGVR